MNWQDIAPVVGALAPTLGKMLGGLAGPVGGAVGGAVGQVVADALGVPATPGAVRDAIEADPAAARAALEPAEGDAKAAMYAYMQAHVTEVNATVRAEMVSGSRWQTGWRPLWGYVSALVWAGMGVAIIRAIFIGDFTVIREIEALTVFLSVAGAVTGVYVWKRSEEKKTAMTGQPLPPIIPRRR